MPDRRFPNFPVLTHWCVDKFNWSSETLIDRVWGSKIVKYFVGYAGNRRHQCLFSCGTGMHLFLICSFCGMVILKRVRPCWPDRPFDNFKPQNLSIDNWMEQRRSAYFEALKLWRGRSARLDFTGFFRILSNFYSLFQLIFPSISWW